MRDYKKVSIFEITTLQKMLTKLDLSCEELNELNYERYHYPCPLVQKRLHAVYIKATTGLSNEMVGLAVDSQRNRVSLWIKTYQNGGLEALMEKNYSSNQSELEQYAGSIKKDFMGHPPRSIGEAVLKIEEATGIKRSPVRMWTWMKRHGFKFLKTGPIPAKANDKKQKKWVNEKLKPAIQAAQDGHSHLLFVDAAHFVLQPFLCCLWCLTRLFVPAPAGRNRINVLGAVDALSKEVTTYINTSYICADSLLIFLKQLRKKYGDKPIAIVLDNARYQHCIAVKTFAESIGIELLFLPPYSPNLNIIERLWKFTKKQILHARYYDEPDKFHSAIKNFFKNINKKYNNDLQSLLTLKFQFFDKNIAPFYAE
jgi:transposase